jgi:hypothetical protein
MRLGEQDYSKLQIRWRELLLRVTNGTSASDKGLWERL